MGSSEDQTYKSLILKVLEDFSNFLKKIGYDIKADSFKTQDNKKTFNFNAKEGKVYLINLE